MLERHISKHPSDVSDYYHIFDRGTALCASMWYQMFKLIQDVPGDIFEFGIGRGKSLISISTLISQPLHLVDKDRHIFAFDSFAGFPDPTEEDISFRQPLSGEWSSSPNEEFAYTPDNLNKVLTLANVDSSKITFVPGYFSDSLPIFLQSNPTPSPAILHLDGDLYISYKDPLSYLFRFMRPGSLIVIDDFYLYPRDKSDAFPGARQAIGEFLADHPNLSLKETIIGTPYIQVV